MDKIDHGIGFLAIDWLQWSDGRFDEDRAEIALKYISQLKAENKRFLAALESISKNTCCDNCQEAKFVALEALKESE